MVHTGIMASEAQMLTSEEFASVLTVGNTPAVNGPPAVIPAEHSARLIALHGRSRGQAVDDQAGTNSDKCWATHYEMNQEHP